MKKLLNDHYNLLFWQSLKSSNCTDMNRNLERILEVMWLLCRCYMRICVVSAFGFEREISLCITSGSNVTAFIIYWKIRGSGGVEGVEVTLISTSKYFQWQTTSDWIDSGPVVSIVNEVTYKKLIQDRRNLSISPWEIYSHAGVPQVEIVSVSVEYNGERKTLLLVVSKGNRPNLPGRNWLAKIKLNWNQIVKPDQMNSMSSGLRSLESSFGEYCEVLDRGEESAVITRFKAHLFPGKHQRQGSYANLGSLLMHWGPQCWWWAWLFGALEGWYCI